MSTTVHNMNMSTKASLPASTARLESWKQIAVYLRREVRTVQRWEKSEGLPIRRHFHVKGATVYALRKEIDDWLTGRSQTRAESRPVQRRSRQAANGLNPRQQVIRQMLAAIRLWRAVVAQESNQDYSEMDVVDNRMAVFGGTRPLRSGLCASGK